MIRRFADRLPILFSIAVLVVSAIVALLTLVLFTGLFGIDMASAAIVEMDFGFLAATTLSKVILSAVLVLILVALKMKSVLTLSGKGIGKGLLLAWFLILLSIALFVVRFDFSNAGSLEPGKLLLLLTLAVNTLFIGISEEVLCRGIFYNVIFNKYRNILAAVFISSAIFGVMHLFNLIGGAPLIETLSQVFYAFALGVLIAAVYARSKNIWAVVLIHAFFDFCSYAPEILTPDSAAAAEAILSNPIITVVFSVVAICMGLFLVRKSKTTDIGLAWKAEPREIARERSIAI